MAIGSGPSGASSQMLKSPKKKAIKVQDRAPLSSPAKRNKSPGIRLIGGRIYDPVNGKTCHQCRQKTRDFVAACKSQKGSKMCTIMYCHKCLGNRYGEKAEEVEALGEWSCPKCRGICNCSVCMKKRGHQPTGILINTAKATGFSSVSEMLLKGAQRLNSENVVAVIAASPKEVTHSPRKRGKENSFDGKIDANLPNAIVKKSKKVKEGHKGNKDNVTSTNQCSDKKKLEQEASAEMHACDKKHGAEGTDSCGAKKSKKTKRNRSSELDNKKDDDEILKEKGVNDVEEKPKKSRKESEDDDRKRNDLSLATRTSPRKLVVSKEIPNQEAKLRVGVDEINTANALVVLKQHNADIFPNIQMPLGTELKNVAGLDVSTEDAGNALQFLEFCAAFGKTLEVKKGQPEHVIKDLFNGRTGRRGKFSVTVQFHMHLLSILQTEQGGECGELSPSVGKNSWFDALKKCFSESHSVLKARGLDCLEKASDYESLEAPEKLRLLNFLCDEILGTEKARSWIDEQNTEFAERVKEAKQNVIAAKEKEKTLKQTMKDNIAKAIIAKHGAPLSISEHEAIVSDIKQKTAEAHAKVLESKDMLLENYQTCNAVRIEPVLVSHGGNAYWKLNSSGNSNVLHQDVGKGDTLTLNEKWFTIVDEGKEVIEKHISSLKAKKLRLR